MKIETITTLVPQSKQSLFRLAIDLSRKEGHCLEFGVWKGGSINYLAERAPDRIFYGFDSFEGLPEDWNKGDNIYHKGHFAVPGLPPVRPNVKLLKGWFEETISIWKAENEGPISFLHIDSDLYSSCVTILEELNDRIIEGTVILFDELCDFVGSYPAWKENEWKAANEWELKYKKALSPIARSSFFQVLTVVEI